MRVPLRRLGRRALLAALGAAAALRPPLAAAQQGLPVVGFLNPRTPGQATAVVAAFRQGLRDAGHEEGRTLAVAYAWAEDRYERLPELAADLVHRRVAVIVAGTTSAARAARAATATIPIVFTSGLDPDALVALGIVASVNRPGANVTGATFNSGALLAKQLELLRELLPGLSRVTYLANPGAAAADQVQTSNAQAAARALGLQLGIVSVSNDRDLETAFAGFANSGAGALLLASDPIFDSRPERVVALAARFAVPVAYPVREYVDAGGLMSYGGSLAGAYRQAGAYAGQILGGAAPGQLPVQQPTRFDLVVNLRSAHALGLMMPATLLARADEVIE